jgi:hypothetical protein
VILRGSFLCSYSYNFYADNFANFRKNSKSLLYVPIDTRKSCLMYKIKPGDEKYRVTVLLISLSPFIRLPLPFLVSF